jgi:putative heme-binding domain-containing protein
VVFSEYQVTVVETKDGRVVNGIVKRETDKAVTLQTLNDTIVIPKNEIESRTRSALSLMPEGLLTNLQDEEVRDLVAYLASPAQVPLPSELPKPRD